MRLLHGATALLVLAAWLSGLFVYSRYDGRWGRLPFTPAGDWIDIHGLIGVGLLVLALPFVAYAFSLGRARLRRATNSLTLVALALAMGSGKLMQEDWLEDGQLHHLVYGLHLLGWLLIGLAVLVHVGDSLRLGGWPLLNSMVSTSLRPGDLPGDWPQQVRRFWKRGR
ncbi:cytochrome b/b6 domain-containing protein [Cyanobium gracile]|uniref:Cytochrome b/b6 domain-containing protein n=1 Tax=Cyanobium gracile UHCC 0281 TaxID=3110309 RepID=A0ABU5STG5_9CYAN|nr:cytochrome b/b6 domain-containing protein [Cyanobium gracile]MEA5441794.1 cytochrome b/b6 domain-containing protein [Cyanobium gracile UHCC 0281]